MVLQLLGASSSSNRAIKLPPFSNSIFMFAIVRSPFNELLTGLTGSTGLDS
jgi:hypothetical protein